MSQNKISEKMARNIHGKGELVCAFLMRKGEGAKESALAIAKALGLKSAKDINPTLYDLQKTGQLHKTDDKPPLWSLKAGSPHTRAGAKFLQPDPPDAQPLPPGLRPGATSPDDSLRQHTCLNGSRQSVASISEDHDSALAELELKIKHMLRSQEGDGWLNVQDIAKKQNQRKTTVNRCLYAMKNRGELENNVKQWRCKDRGDNSGHNMRSLEEFSDIKMLGDGGFGSVYRVQHKVDGNWYAVKIAKYKGNDEKREVETLVQLNHSNIVRYFTSWIGPFYQHNKASSKGTRNACEEEESEEAESGLAESSNTTSDTSAQQNNTAGSQYIYIMMELCTGGSLHDWFRKGGAERTKEAAMNVFQQIVEGVAHIHSKDIIHRDLKPDNILFGSDNTVKIGDFGLATRIHDQSGQPIERTKGRGTETYMSPEQENQSDYNEKTDIFPLGLILFELLWKMKTCAERGKIWPNLRKGDFPDGFTEEFSFESPLIKAMLSEGPKKRPAVLKIRKYLDSQETKCLQEANTV